MRDHRQAPHGWCEALAARLDEPKFGHLSEKDRLLLRHAILLRWKAFLLPSNAGVSGHRHSRPAFPFRDRQAHESQGVTTMNGGKRWH
jgi:hypothetical protein